MGKYLFEANYTLEGMKGVAAKGGSSRKTVLQAAAKSLGGKVESFYFAFGGTDVYCVAELPDNTAAAALALSVAAGGGATVRTVVLLATTEIDEALGKKVGYKAPGK